MTHTLASLQKWGLSSKKELPNVDKIKHIHVYDFDNTLFASPTPNSQLWDNPTVGLLQHEDEFKNGGWWHDSNILAATGRGLESEETAAWEGWWNQSIVDLVMLSMEQPDALSILLTGRSEKGFGDLVQRMVNAKKLEFDMLCLKPTYGPQQQQFRSTGQFKLVFLEDLIRTYPLAEEIRVYEDRTKHVTMFQDFFADLNSSLLANAQTESRRPIHAEVIEVVEKATKLDPVTEVAEVQRMINAHNASFLVNGKSDTNQETFWELKRSVLYTGYLISPEDSKRLLGLATLPTDRSGVRTYANNIIITPRPCPQFILNKVGGMGRKMKWRVVALGRLEESIWAARVEPVPPTERIHIESQVPFVVLACRSPSRPADGNRIKNWNTLPLDKQFEFETVVGEKVLLRVVEDDGGNQHYNDNRSNGRGTKRIQLLDEDEFPALGSSQGNGHGPSQKSAKGSEQQSRNYGSNDNFRPSPPVSAYARTSGASGRGNLQPFNRGNSNNKGNRGGTQRVSNSGRGRGRGSGGYKSLDDAGNRFGLDGAADDGGLSY